MAMSIYDRYIGSDGRGLQGCKGPRHRMQRDTHRLEVLWNADGRWETEHLLYACFMFLLPGPYLDATAHVVWLL